MVGALSVVGSTVMESHTGPCLCLDALPTTNMNLKSGGGDLVLQRNSIKSKHMARSTRLVELSSCFSRHDWRVSSRVSSRKHRRDRRLVVVSELGGQYEDTFEDVKLQIQNYFTYKAVRTVLNQLYEMNPPQYRWFYNFVAMNKPGDGKRFIRTLGKEQQDLAERVMVTRLHLYGKWIKLMRERLMETVIWPSDDTNTEKIG